MTVWGENNGDLTEQRGPEKLARTECMGFQEDGRKVRGPG